MNSVTMKIKMIRYTTLLIIFIHCCNFTTVSAMENLVIDGGGGVQKIVYLTFDDGPSFGITDKLLDVLHKYNVKATFFVVGKEIKGRERILRRISDEGHSIGLHTYSHKFSAIYKSDEAFLEELKREGELIKYVLGYKVNVIRFPGGSDLMLTPELLEKLHKLGYRVYDWNVNLGDGVAGNLSVETLIRNSKKVKGDKYKRFILAHCNSNNKTTYRALPYIIEYYKSEGYVFKAIDNNTEEYFYKLKKKKK